jgi:transposase
MVLGMAERNGDIITKVLENRKGGTLLPIIKHRVKRHTEVQTDDLIAYGSLGTMGYWHKSVCHNREEYVSSTGTTVNCLGGFWSQQKRGINGTHIYVSGKHLPKYLGEFEFRGNMQDQPYMMLDRLMVSFSC